MTSSHSKHIQNIISSPHENTQYFLILDGSAHDNTIPATIYQLEHVPRIAPLFRYTPYASEHLSGPLLIQISRNSPLWNWYFSNSNGETGILLYGFGVIDVAMMASHLRTYVEAILPSGKKMLFRFYDPRSFCYFWPSLDKGERELFLGPAIGVAYCEPDTQSGTLWHCDRIDSPRVTLPENIKKYPWIISDATYAALERPFIYSMGKRMAENFRDFYPARARILKKDSLHAFGDLVVAKGFGMGCRAESELNCLMICMAQLGSFFDTDLQYPWANLKLQQGQTTDNRLMQISDMITEMHKTLWGNFGLPYQRALRAVHEAVSWDDLDKIKTREQAVFILPQLFREKARFQGNDSLASLFDYATDRGAKYGIQSVKGCFILSVAFFFLGSSADKDPLYPWLGDILCRQCEEEEKLQALFVMGQKRARSEYLIQRRLTGVALYDNIHKACTFVRWAPLTELSVPLKELLEQFSLPVDFECLDECCQKSAKLFSEAEHSLAYSLCTLALWFSKNYPSPAGYELHAVLANIPQLSVKDSSDAIERWLRDAAASLEINIENHILVLED